MIDPARNTPASAAKPADTSAGKPAEASLRKAAQAFEAVFLRQMIGSMRQASLGDDVLGSSAADQFRDMSDSRLADQMAAGKGFGIADLLVRQFQRNGGAK